MTAAVRHGLGAPRRASGAWWATMARIAAQLRTDHRTVAIVLVMPLLLITLLYFAFIDVPVPPGTAPVFNTLGPLLLAVLPMMLMFIVTSVIMLRERVSGTLERLLTTPISRWNLVASYGAAFGVLGVVQGCLLATAILGPMGVEIRGAPSMLLLVALLDAVVGVAFGLLASAFARTEFQAVQFMPLFVGPQLFLCGLLVDTEHMPDALAFVAGWLPMTWAVEAVSQVISGDSLSSGFWLRIGMLAGLAVTFLVVAAASMPRRTR